MSNKERCNPEPVTSKTNTPDALLGKAGITFHSQLGVSVEPVSAESSRVSNGRGGKEEAAVECSTVRVCSCSGWGAVLIRIATTDGIRSTRETLVITSLSTEPTWQMCRSSYSDPDRG